MDYLPDQQAQKWNSGKVIPQPLSLENVERLKRTLTQLNSDPETARRFAIYLDGEMIIAPTSDMERFNDYTLYVDEYCSCLEVRVFFGSSPNYRAHRFLAPNSPLFGIHQPQRQLGLGEIEINEKIESAVSRERQYSQITFLEHQLKLLQEENLKLKKKLKKSKELNLEVQEKLKEAQDKLKDNSTNYSELLTKGIELFGLYQATKNGMPAPSQQDISGVDIQLQPEQPSSTYQSENTTHTSQREEPQSDSELDSLVSELKKEYSEDQIVSALRVTELLAAYPELKDEFTAIIQSKINSA